MANIGTFTAERRLHRHASHPDAQCQGQAGCQRQGRERKRPDFRLQAAGYDIGAGWKKTSEAGRPYVSVSLDDPSFPVTVYARLIENEDGTHDLIWSRSKPRRPDGRPSCPPLAAGRDAVDRSAARTRFRRLSHAPMSRAGIVLVMVEWLEARGNKRKMACRRWKRRRAFGLRPVPASRHGHVASIPHAFAPGGAARSACGYVSDAAIWLSVSAISTAVLQSSARAILKMTASVGMCSPRSTLPMCERSMPARCASDSWAIPRSIRSARTAAPKACARSASRW